MPIMPLPPPLPPAPDRITGQPTRVGPTTQQHEALVASRVEDAVRHQPLLRGDKIVVLDDHAAVSQGPTPMEEIAEDLLLFGVDAQDRPIPPLVPGSQLGDESKLLVALGKATRRFVLERLAARQTQLVE